MRAFLAKAPDRTSPFFTARRRHDAGLPFLWHFHREYELTFIATSRGRRFIGDHIEDYREGDLLLIGPYLPHTWSSDPKLAGPHGCAVVHFSVDLFGRDALNHPGLEATRALLEQAAHGVRFGAEVAAEVGPRLMELAGERPLEQLATFVSVLDRLSAARDRQALSTRSWGVAEFEVDLRPIDRVCRFLNTHYLRPISLDEAAAEAGLSPSAFARLFRRSTGKTLTEYVNGLRLAHACQLLLETDRTVADIAASSGFANVPYFNRRFLRLKRVTPAVYRRSARLA